MKVFRGLVQTFVLFLLPAAHVCFADGHWETVLLDEIGRDYTITAMAAAPNGNVWIGTYPGRLYRFDGEDCTLVADYSDMKIEWIRSLDFAPDGSLWIGGYTAYGVTYGQRNYSGGISHFNGESWTHYSEEDGLASSAIKTIAVGDDGAVWAGAEHYVFTNSRYFRGITRFDGVSYTIFDTTNGLSDNRINDLTFDNGGSLWAATGDGISIYDGASWTILTSDEGLPGEYIKRIAFDHGGLAWICTTQALIEYDGDIFTLHTPEDICAGEAVIDVCVDSVNMVWTLTDNGISCYDGIKWHQVKKEENVWENITHIACGSDGFVWCIETRYNDNDEITEKYLCRYIRETDVASEPTPQPFAVSCSPNPFNAMTTLSFTLPSDMHITARVYNALGQRITTFADEMMPAGHNSLVWNGNDDNGNPASSGVYIVRIGNNDFHAVRRMTLLR